MSRQSNKKAPFLLFSNSHADNISTFRQYCLENPEKIDLCYISTLWHFSLKERAFKSSEDYDDLHEALIDLMEFLKTDQFGKLFSLKYFSHQGVAIEKVLKKLRDSLNESYVNMLKSVDEVTAESDCRVALT